MKVDWNELEPAGRDLLEKVRSVARSRRLRTFLVGGPVRDLQLGRPLVDFDFMVEGDASAFVIDLSVALGGEVKAFAPFLTWKIVREGTPPIDITTARLETYSRGGALPAVTRATVEEDLWRRDFSVNALAAGIEDGVIVDPTGGLEDLRSGLIRALHARSFLDDPTRFLRAFRFSSRLGFAIEENTAAWITAAIEAAAMLSVSRERLWREFLLMIEDSHAAYAITQACNSGALESLLGQVDMTPDRARFLERLEAEPPSHLDRPVVALSVLFLDRPGELGRLEGSGLSAARIRNITHIVNSLPELVTRSAPEPGKLRRISDEMLWLAAATSEKGRMVAGRIESARGIHLPFSAADLDLPPGPHLGYALERTQDALARHEIEEDAALAFARAAALQYLNERT